MSSMALKTHPKFAPMGCSPSYPKPDPIRRTFCPARSPKAMRCVTRALTPFPPLLARPPRGQEGIALTISRSEIVWIQVSHATIDADYLPGDKVREVGGEKLDHFDTIFRLPQPSHGNVGHQIPLDLPEATHPVHRCHIARSNSVDCHADGSNLQGEGAGQLHNAA